MYTSKIISTPLIVVSALFLTISLQGHSSPAAPDKSVSIQGPYQITRRNHQMSAQYFYIYNATGNPFTIDIQCLELAPTSPAQHIARNSWMVRVFDADEYLFFRDYITSPDRTSQEQIPSHLSIDVPGSDPNRVIQVVVGGGRVPAGTFSLQTTPTLPFGIMGSVNVVTPPKNGIKSGYFYIPPGARKLELQPVSSTVQVWDENDRPVSNLSSIPIEKTGVVWKMNVEPTTWPGAKIFARGFPVIVCPDPQTAGQIKASFEQLDDGTIVAHKFQVRLDRLLRETFSDPKQFKLFPIRSLEPLAPVFAQDPLRYRYLVDGVYPYINFWLDTQILDSKSPFFGGIYCPAAYLGTNREPYAQMPEGATVPPATHAQKHHQWVGFSPWQIHHSMAFLYSLNDTVNPYHGDKNLLHRVLISTSRDLMLLDEQELLHGQDRYTIDWMKTYSWNFYFRFADAVGHIGRDVRELYPDIYREWTQGLQRFADRITDMNIFPPANQSAHIPYCLWRMYEGTSDLYYYQQAQDTLKQFIDRLQKPAGYYIESYGPCSGYTFITLERLAAIYRDTGWPFLKDSIQRAQYFFNHAAVPETSTDFIGSSDFNHRNEQPWARARHRGGRIKMAGELPEAGLWFRNITAAQEQSARRSIIARLARLPYSTQSLLDDPSFNVNNATGSARRPFRYHYETLNTDGKLPCEEPHSFIRNIGDEFIAVKRPGYYLLIYVGKPGAATKDIAPERVGPRTGGGISLLWTPDYKTVIAAQNWNTFCHHGIIVETDKPNYADYDSVEFALDTDNATLTVSAKISNTPISYVRHYKFEDTRISVSTELTSTADFAAQQSYLQVPLFMSKHPAAPRLQMSDGSFFVRDRAGRSVQFAVYPSLPAQKGQLTQKCFEGTDYHIQQIKFMLPDLWAQGQTIKIDYQLRF